MRTPPFINSIYHFWDGIKNYFVNAEVEIHIENTHNFEGNGYLVGWCLGHLAQLVSAEAYDPQLSRWRVTDLPILPQDWRYRVPQEKRKQFGILRGLMLRDDVSQVINACDAGREGELIFRNLYELTGCTKPTLRLWLN